MTRVFLADGQLAVRSALRLLLLDIDMRVVGVAADWAATVARAAKTVPDMLLVDWDLIPPGSALMDFRATCPAAAFVVLISQLDGRQRDALSSGADSYISKGETPVRVAQRLRAAAARGRPS